MIIIHYSDQANPVRIWKTALTTEQLLEAAKQINKIKDVYSAHVNTDSSITVTIVNTAYWTPALVDRITDAIKRFLSDKDKGVPVQEVAIPSISSTTLGSP